MSDNIGVKLNRMCALLEQILERMPPKRDDYLMSGDSEVQIPQGPLGLIARAGEMVNLADMPVPHKRGWPKGKSRKARS